MKEPSAAVCDTYPLLTTFLQRGKSTRLYLTNSFNFPTGTYSKHGVPFLCLAGSLQKYSSLNIEEDIDNDIVTWWHCSHKRIALFSSLKWLKKIKVNIQFGSGAFISKVLRLDVHSYSLTCNTKNNQMSGLPIAWMKTLQQYSHRKKKKITMWIQVYTQNFK